MAKVAIYGCKSIDEEHARALLDRALIAPVPSASAIWYGGGPRGVDKAALEWSALELVTPFTTEAQWDRYKARCGEVRGRWVATWCDAAVVLWDPFAPEPEGTLASLVREALLLSKRVRMVVVSESFELDRFLDAPEVDASFLLGALVRPRDRRRRRQAA